MSFIKKVTAVLISAVMLLSLAACGESSTWAAKINNTELRAGIYIYFSMEAYFDATSKLEEGQTDVFSITIDGKNAEQWIKDEATRYMQEYVAVEEKFTELGLTLSEDEINQVKSFAEQMWQYYGSVYEGYGISQQSSIDISINGLRKNAIFDYYYGDEGIEKIDENIIKDYISENYAYINSIKMELKDGEGNLLKSDGKAEIEKMAESYIDRAKSGEDFNKLVDEYNAYYQNLVSEAQQKAAADSGLLTDGTGAIEVQPSDAQTNSADENTNETTFTAKVLEVTDNTITVEPVEGSNELNSADKITLDKLDADVIVGDNVKITYNGGIMESYPAQITATKVEKIEDAAQPTPEQTEEETQDYSTVVKKDSATPSKTVCDKLFDGSMKYGDIVLIKEDEVYYVVSYMDILEKEGYYDSSKKSVLHEIKDEEFDTLVSTWTANQTVDLNEKAYNRYDVKKFAETEAE